MLTLPRGVPVHTDVPTSRDTIPDFLGRLAGSGFTGYAQYNFQASMAVLLFSGGKLLSAMLSRGGARVANLDALTELCRRAATEEGTVDVFRLETDLTMALHGLLHGDALIRDQELTLLDVKALTAQLKAQRFNGCIRVHAGDRTSLVFYRDGAGFGFFHDGGLRIETTATESQKIANLPGARMDVLATRPVEQLQSYDILDVVNLPRLWDTTVQAVRAEYEKLRKGAEEGERARLAAALAGLTGSLELVAVDVLGPPGKALLAKELAQVGGAAALVQPERLAGFVQGLEKGARLLAGATKVKELARRVSTAVEHTLAGRTGS